MRILVAHNSYVQSGGEDQCVTAEIAMLEAYGHEVVQYRVSNDAIEGMGRLALGMRTVWSQPAFRRLREILRTSRPHIAHFHNTLPLVSPAAYYAARMEAVPVVQTLHNFRVCCVNALLYRDGAVCEDCVGKAAPWRGVVRRCYRGSAAAGGAIAAMIATHHALGTWRSAVDAYVALTDFSRRKFVAAGLPAERIVIKPNFAYPDPSAGTGAGRYAVFVGRLSAEKGIPTLIEAWRRLPGVPLKVIGDGPLAPIVAAAAQEGIVEWLHQIPHESVYEFIGDAAFLVMPSTSYENFPCVVIEAFAKGTPVVASRLGAMAEIVEDGGTGAHFRPGDPDDLAAKVRALMSDPDALLRMRWAARRTFESKFTAKINHQTLMAIYARARALHRCLGEQTYETCMPHQ